MKPVLHSRETIKALRKADFTLSPTPSSARTSSALHTFGKSQQCTRASDVKLVASQQPFPDEEHINSKDVHQNLQADCQAVRISLQT